MNQWVIDKIKESMDFCVTSNNARLETSAIFTKDEAKELQTHYDAITKILLTSMRRQINNI